MTTSFLVAADEIFAESGIKKDALLLVEGERFAGFIGEEEATAKGLNVKRFPGRKLLPGLFDSHIHGAFGSDTMDASPKALDRIGGFLLSEGTTSWMPTTVTAPFDSIKKALASVSAYRPSERAARVFGCFVEGPYLTEEHRGAHPAEYLRELANAELDELLASGPVRALAVAPEKAGAATFIRYAMAKGVHISLGHSGASYEESMRAMQCGADAVIHTFCGMTSLHHRSPNLLGAALTCDRLYAELIADGLHVKVPAMEILRRCKLKDKLILISDALRAAGLPDGNYLLGVEPFTVDSGVARTKSGALAGSVTTLLKEVRRFITELGEEPLTAVHMASLNPSRRFGLEHEIGSVCAGKLADFLIVDESYNLREVWKGGRQAFVKT